MKTGVRAVVETLARRTLRTDLPAFVVASFGRSGSTLLTKALAASVARKRFGTSTRSFRGICRDKAWHLETAPVFGGVVYQTHDYPWAVVPIRPVNPIFIFGSAVEAAQSVYNCQFTFGSKWLAEHFAHLHHVGAADDFLNYDALGFLRQAKEWGTYDKVNVLCIGYEALWENLERVRSFTGLPLLRLPERLARQEKVLPPEVEERIGHVYTPVDEYLRGLPDIFETNAAGTVGNAYATSRVA